MTPSNPSHEQLSPATRLKAWYLLIAAIFFAYVLVRAFSVGATIDEITTMQGARDLSFLDILSESHPIANNHILNTLLIKVLFSLGLDSLAIIRMPNVLSFALYIYWGYKISAKRLAGLLGLGCFFLLMCNPFLLDFFSLARGYGMSLGFMMGALYFGSKSLRDRSTWSLSISLLLASLSVYSIFSMIYFWIGLSVGLISTCFIRREWLPFKKSISLSFLIGSALLALIAVPVFRLMESHALFYGGNSTFYDDTLVSLTRYSLYSLDITPSIHFVLNTCIGALIFIVAASCFNKKERDGSKNLFLVVGIFSIALIVLAHHLVGVLYPINRVALFLYPLFILSLCVGLDSFNSYVRTLSISVFILGFGFNFISRGNSYRTALWSFDAHTEEVLSQINAIGEETGKVISFACTPVIYHSVNYYAKRNNYSFLKVIQEEGRIAPEGVDYYLFSDRDTAAFSEESFIKNSVRPLDAYDKTTIIDYPKDHLFVFKNLRKHAIKTH